MLRPTSSRRLAAVLGFALVACRSPVSAASSSAVVSEPPSAARSAASAVGSAIPATPVDPPGFYLGREIAPTMSHEGADWLIRPEREAEEKASVMLAELRLTPGMVACDLGAGNGFHSLPMARSVSPTGRVIAVDVQPEMLELLKTRAKAEGVTNIEAVLGEPADPKLPKGGCDRILLADVYHELDDPAGMLAHLRAALREDGLLVLLEFRSEDASVPIKPEHKMSRAQILKEIEHNGFELARSYDGLPWQHLMFFARRR